MEFLEEKIYQVILRTYWYMEETGRGNSFGRFPYLRTLTERLSEELPEAGTGMQAMRYRKILCEIGAKNDGVLCTVMDLCLAAMHVPEFAGYLNYYTGNTVTIQLAFELEGIPYPAFPQIYSRIKQIQKICRVDRKKNPVQYAAIEADDLLLSYLTGEEKTEERTVQGAEWFWQEEKLHAMFIQKELPEICADCLTGKSGILQISGSSGTCFLAKHTAHLLKKDLLMIDAGKCKDLSGEDCRQFSMELVRSVFLRNGIVCIYGISEELFRQSQMKKREFLEYLALPFWEAEIPILLCCKPGVPLLRIRQVSVAHVEIKEMGRAEREAVFRGFAGLYGISIDPALYSVRYRLSASEIAQAVEIWRNKNPIDGTGQEEIQFSRICSSVLQNGQEKMLGEVYEPVTGFSDLKVPAYIREILGQICCSVTEGYRIFEEWNLKHQYPYGKAVTVLLAGPPGTGKTMTAHVLAKELGISLYQVDLSHMIDKYIGETEKHIDHVFAFAEKTNMLLFFDEADALFGKRGEVTEGRDRYANMEVSYILQRIEQFDGIVVLATNFYGNIDKAFLRRMKYVLKYQAPDEKLRRSIWEGCLPSERLREELDMDYLARQFDFTGGMIKNVVLNACVMAVYEGKKLGMVHILKAVGAEYEKMERAVSKDFFGEYGGLMEGDL